MRFWADFRDDDDLDVAIWTGEGSAFCAGADRNTWFDQWLEADALDVRNASRATGFGGLPRGLHRIYKPVIGAINGWALGGGLELALACDIRIASEHAMFGTPLVNIGFHHGDGGIVRLVNACGLAVALDLELSGEAIDAQRALQWSLVTRVVPHDELLTAARSLAERILAADQVAVRSAKEIAFDVVGRPLDEQLRLEAHNAYALTSRMGQLIDTIRMESGQR